MKHLYYATGNENKFREAKAFMEDTRPSIIIDHFPVDIPEIQSVNPDTILDHKIDFVQQQTNAPFIVDDASFYTDRFPDFPGSYAKFINESLGYEGWRSLYHDGDSISAVARLALHNFGDVMKFDGSLDGEIDLSIPPATDEKFTLNKHFILPDGRTLEDSLADSGFRNHRRIALDKLGEYIVDTEDMSKASKETISNRWSERASGWQQLIDDEESYVNHEDNYERVNALIRKYGPLASGAALEIGCGTGEAGRILKSSNPNLRLLATDISEGMLSEAQSLSDNEGLGIEYRKVDVTGDELADESFDIVISRGVVVSHLPKSDIFDFLEKAAGHTAYGGHFLFDFIQDTSVGEIEKPVDAKNEFTLSQMDEIMNHFKMARADDEGDDKMRVRVVCYKKIQEDKI